MNIWRRLALDIKERGMSFQQQSIELNKGFSTFQTWVKSENSDPKPCEPRWLDGHKILDLHASICGAELTHERLIKYLQDNEIEIRFSVVNIKIN